MVREKDKITLSMLRQIGVEGIVTALHDIPNGGNLALRGCGGNAGLYRSGRIALVGGGEPTGE